MCNWVTGNSMARMDWRRAKVYRREWEPRPSGISLETVAWAAEMRARAKRRTQAKARAARPRAADVVVQDDRQGLIACRDCGTMSPHWLCDSCHYRQRKSTEA